MWTKHLKNGAESVISSKIFIKNILMFMEVQIRDVLNMVSPTVSKVYKWFYPPSLNAWYTLGIILHAFWIDNFILNLPLNIYQCFVFNYSLNISQLFLLQVDHQFLTNYHDMWYTWAKQNVISLRWYNTK